MKSVFRDDRSATRPTAMFVGAKAMLGLAINRACLITQKNRTDWHLHLRALTSARHAGCLTIR
jgi:hypothetical protein